MFIGNRQKEAIYLSSPVYRCRVDRSNSEKLTRFKIAAETLMTFAGEFFTEVAIMLFKLKSVLYPPDATVINRRRQISRLSFHFNLNNIIVTVSSISPVKIHQKCYQSVSCYFKPC